MKRRNKIEEYMWFQAKFIIWNYRKRHQAARLQRRWKFVHCEIFLFCLKIYEITRDHSVKWLWDWESEIVRVCVQMREKESDFCFATTTIKSIPYDVGTRGVRR